MGLTDKNIDAQAYADVDAKKHLATAVKKGDPCLTFCWTEAKKSLAASSTLSAYDPSLTVYVTTDASRVAWGVYVTQDPKQEPAPIAWLSGTFKPAERHWHSTHSEMFALVAVIRQHPEIFGSGAPTHVRTDSEHLVRWSQLEITRERLLARWNETFVQHDLHFEQPLHRLACVSFFPRSLKKLLSPLVS